MQSNKTVEDYLQANPKWRAELLLLRKILQATEMQETVKWGIPTYTVNGKNVVGMGAFKTYVGIWFFQGSFLLDQHNKLINAQEGKTRGMRQWRFAAIDEIDPKLVAEYLHAAITNQKAGKEIKPTRNNKLVIPPELHKALKNQAKFKKAFEVLTPGKQREYADYITEAKRDATKLTRLAKITPMVLAGSGLYDKYKNC